MDASLALLNRVPPESSGVGIAFAIAYLSASLLIGLGLNARLGWWWADPVAGLAMVPFILWQGRSAIREARSAEED